MYVCMHACMHAGMYVCMYYNEDYSRLQMKADTILSLHTTQKQTKQLRKQSAH